MGVDVAVAVLAEDAGQELVGGQGAHAVVDQACNRLLVLGFVAKVGEGGFTDREGLGRVCAVCLAVLRTFQSGRATAGRLASSDR